MTPDGAPRRFVPEPQPHWVQCGGVVTPLFGGSELTNGFGRGPLRTPTVASWSPSPTFEQSSPMSMTKLVSSWSYLAPCGPVAGGSIRSTAEDGVQVVVLADL